MGQPLPLFAYFRSFLNKQYNSTTNKCEKCQSSIRRWDSNPRPFEHKSSPITTIPGLPPKRLFLPLCVPIVHTVTSPIIANGNLYLMGFKYF